MTQVRQGGCWCNSFHWGQEAGGGGGGGGRGEGWRVEGWGGRGGGRADTTHQGRKLIKKPAIFLKAAPPHAGSKQPTQPTKISPSRSPMGGVRSFCSILVLLLYCYTRKTAGCNGCTEDKTVRFSHKCGHRDKTGQALLWELDKNGVAVRVWVSPVSTFSSRRSSTPDGNPGAGVCRSPDSQQCPTKACSVAGLLLFLPWSIDWLVGRSVEIDRLTRVTDWLIGLMGWFDWSIDQPIGELTILVDRLIWFNLI